MTVLGGMTFRDAIESNKRKIVAYLSDGSKKSTRDICDYYGGERGMTEVRKALNELRKEGKVTTDDKVAMWHGKSWRLTEEGRTQG